MINRTEFSRNCLEKDKRNTNVLMFVFRLADPTPADFVS